VRQAGRTHFSRGPEITARFSTIYSVDLYQTIWRHILDEVSVRYENLTSNRVKALRIHNLKHYANLVRNRKYCYGKILDSFGFMIFNCSSLFNCCCNCICIVFSVCSVSFIVCVVLCVVCYSCDVCYLCVVLLQYYYHRVETHLQFK
jgi:hypothetical protein